ncbi:MAG TPA: class I SAM-dependent methyltransferase, partial [Victivallales bacterium]|nr:class I SAM-dependent methyltransferase [Victivallales bacterium]
MIDKKCYLCGSDRLQMISPSTRDREIGVLKCEACKLVQLEHPIKNIEEFYENSFREEYRIVPEKQEIEGYIADAERWLSQLSDTYAVQGKTILDIGCGEGYFLKKCLEKNAIVYGVEPHKLTRERLIKDGFEVYEKNSLAGNKKFDIATCMHVLEHIPDPISFLKEISKLVKKGGRIFVEV